MPIDVILTSFNRVDLLDITLSSFFKYNTAELGRFIIYDDYGWDRMDDAQREALSALCDKYNSIEIICGTNRIGQIRAIDELVKLVTTEYYFHMEDDWEFLQSGFIEASLSVLEQHSDIIQCWLRGVDDTNGHPVIKHNEIWSYMSTKYEWKGFSFNPALRRLSDYTIYNDICKFNPNDPGNSEKQIGNYYHKQGFQACILNEKYVRHIGDNRGIRK